MALDPASGQPDHDVVHWTHKRYLALWPVVVGRTVLVAHLAAALAWRRVVGDGIVVDVVPAVPGCWLFWYMSMEMIDVLLWLLPVQLVRA